MSPTAALALAIAGLFVVVVLGHVVYTYLKKRQVERLVPPRGAFVTISTGRVHYLTCGEGPEILMIHGLGGQMGNFDTGLLDDLARDHRVTIVDRPGMGYSARGDDAPVNPIAQAAQMAEVMDALRIERPLVVGHSLGGTIALAMALRHGKRLRGLALLSPLTLPVRNPPEAFEPLAIRTDLMRRLLAWTFAVPTMVRRPEPVEEMVFGPEPIPPSYAVRGGGLLTFRPKSFIQTSRDYLNTTDDVERMTREYVRLTLPVRILYGTEDRILDPDVHGTGLISRHPHFGLEMIEGGHMIPVTQPTACADFIRRASLSMT